VAVNFWDLDHPAEKTALIHEATGRKWSYAEVRIAALAFAEKISANGKRQLGFILSANTPECVAAYVGALQANHPIALFAADLAPTLLSRLLGIYQPEWILDSMSATGFENYTPTDLGNGYRLWKRIDGGAAMVSPEVALLLSTSGSTGAPKLVRLCHANIQSNAQSISDYLGLNPEERPITSLPFQYSYGLSVINSHLLVGATILLTNKSVMQRDFLNFVRDQRATSLAGVPYTYQMLLRTKLLDRDLPFRTLTQAGGRLDSEHIASVHAIAAKTGCRFFVMYGQTEATARISFVPPTRLLEKRNSVGIPIPGGNLRVDETTSELIYEGPNVMLGYAENRTDLSKGDELHGVLRTGDLGRKDQDGFFYVTGRNQRFLKMFGQRVSLDDVERVLGTRFHVPLACFGSDDNLRIAVEDELAFAEIQPFVCELYNFHHSAVHVQHVPQLPINSSGKVDYSALAGAVSSNSSTAATVSP
jgi:long-chain acyl-CoA synthetase